MVGKAGRLLSHRQHRTLTAGGPSRTGRSVGEMAKRYPPDRAMRAAVRSAPQSTRNVMQPNPAAQVNARRVAARRTVPHTADGAIPGSAGGGYRSTAPGRLPHPGDALSDVGWVVVRRPWSDDPWSPDTWGFASRGA